MFDSLSFEDAVRLFKEWGFVVEPGPMPEEVTLIIDAPDHRTYCVYEAQMLPQIAAAALRVRLKTGRLFARPASRGQRGSFITHHCASYHRVSRCREA